AGLHVPVTGIGFQNAAANVPLVNQTVRGAAGGTEVYPKAVLTGGSSPTTTYFKGQGNSTDNPDIYVDLSGVTTATADINQWRQAMAIQRIREHRNRFGSRYRDYLAFLGVRSSDARLQRPEYLGGGKVTLSFSEVLSTADVGTADVGTMAGHGIAAL